jgi:hypothetical protein
MAGSSGARHLRSLNAGKRAGRLLPLAEFGGSFFRVDPSLAVNDKSIDVFLRD